MSLNDRPEVRKIFRDFDIEGVEMTYSIGGEKMKNKKFGEVLISG
jgi:hypothetical protein